MKPYYEDGSTAIYLGNCVDVLPLLEDDVDHCITDPPYSEHTHAKNRRGGHDISRKGDGSTTRAGISRTRDLGFASLSPEVRIAVAREIRRLTKRWVLVFSDIESCHLWRASLSMRCRFRTEPLEYIRTGAWRKIGSTPQFTGDRPATSFEAITIAHRAGVRKRWNGGGRHGWYDIADGGDPIWMANIVLDRGRNSPRLHTTQKPLSLMSALVEDFTDPGDLILDPFCGSGTTLRAAKDLGRRSIGIEEREEWAEVAAERMSQGVLDLAPQQGRMF